MRRRFRWLWAMGLATGVWPVMRPQPAQATPVHARVHPRGAQAVHEAAATVVRAAAALEAARAVVRHPAHADHAAALADCHTRWGRELGPLLCPAMFADEEASAGQANVEVRLLGALWHIAGRQAGVWWRRGGQAAGALWKEVQVLHGGDDAP